MFLLTNRNVLCLLGIAIFLRIGQAKGLVKESSTVNTTDDLLRQPKERTREEWMACRGIPKDVCEKIKIKRQEPQKALAKKFGLDSIKKDSSSNDNGEHQRIAFTEEQLDMMIAEVKKEKMISRHRAKRTLLDFELYDNTSMWSMPIPYMFDGKHDRKQRARIRAAFQHWTDNTCIRFRELPTYTSFDSNYILIAKNESVKCQSKVGRIDEIPQNINLASRCLAVFGTILHEIGHSLGLVHEQSRLGRNDSITILWNNIEDDHSNINYQEEETDDFGLPYNYGSIMHYSSKNGYSVNGSDTMIALDPLYQMNMGQAVDLSFHDRKIINLAYCKDTCKTPLTQLCQRSGYQNPNNCSACICPDGFSGQYCNKIAQPKYTNCGGVLNITSGTEQVIKSPGYDDTGYNIYVHQECTWWIKAPENYMLQLSFIGNFSIYCHKSACTYDWVEIKYKKDLGLEGARFCCYHRPIYNVTSESNEMMVIFRSYYDAYVEEEEREEEEEEEEYAEAEEAFYPHGFQAIVTSIPQVVVPQVVVPQVSSRSSPTSNPAAGAIWFLLLSVPLQLHYLPYC